MNKIDPASTTRRDFERLPAELIAAARELPAATLHEAGSKLGALPSAIKPTVRSSRLCGPALTVHSPGGDNLWLHRALDIARPGDVMVVYTNGVYEHGYWGEIMSTAAKARGLGGLVIDACVRDAVLLEAIGFPVFARGLCIRGTGKDLGAIGWINEPVLIGDVTVSAGDLVVGDADGVVVIPRGRAADVVAVSQKREQDEAKILEQVGAGKSTLDVYAWL